MSEPAVVVPPPVRCAIYTRKSTEEGLEKEFNSLDAQREAAEAFILSQRQEGWLALPHKYDDGGFTGANMERPALAKLMADNWFTREHGNGDLLSRLLRAFMSVWPPNGHQREENDMDAGTVREIEELRSGSISQVREKYREVFGEEPRSKHKDHLFRRLAWRLQALAEGGLSERALRRAHEIANEADLRVRPPRGMGEAQAGQLASAAKGRVRSRYDRRIPPPGTVLSRAFHGETITVQVLADGFEYQGRCYRSLSAIACQVTGTRWNGLAFFGLTGKRFSAKRNRHAGKR